jgi:glycosyltransferase involved in cell wall biosynthesis
MSKKTHHQHDLPAAVLEPKRPTQLAYILAYRAPDYVRSQSLLQALGNCTHIELLVARNRNTGIKRYAETWRALRQLRKAHSPDIYVLGFRGHEMFWPVRWLTCGKPLVFDALMSPSAALREENKAGWLGRLLAPVMRHLERSILQHADLVLTDTTQHAAFYETQFGLPKEKVLVIPVGAVEIGASSEATEEIETATTLFSVLFYGSMLPLHGIDIIVSAAAQLSDLPIRFDFVGGNAQQAQRLHNLCATYGVTRYTQRRWVPLDELIAFDIPRTHLCLGGPFGGTPQARRVITGKTSQCLALGKATIIGAIDEDTGFLDKYNCLLVPQADATALAATLRWSFVHRDALSSIGQRGRALYHERFSVNSIAQQLIPALQKLCEAHHGKS